MNRILRRSSRPGQPSYFVVVMVCLTAAILASGCNGSESGPWCNNPFAWVWWLIAAIAASSGVLYWTYYLRERQVSGWDLSQSPTVPRWRISAVLVLASWVLVLLVLAPFLLYQIGEDCSTAPRLASPIALYLGLVATVFGVYLYLKNRADDSF